MYKIHQSILYEDLTAENLRFLKNLGLAPELSIVSNSADLFDSEENKRIAQLFIEYGFNASVHAPFSDLNPGSFDRLVRQAFEQRIIQAVETADAVSSKTLVVHPGYGVFNHIAQFENWFERALSALKHVVSAAAEKGITIVFENIYDPVPDYLFQLIKRLDFENVRICFDVGHFNAFSQVNIHNWLSMLGEHIIEVHLHDNDGTGDQHLSLGDGNFNFNSIAAWIKSRQADDRPLLTMEVREKTHVVKSLNIINNLLEGS